MTTRSPCWRIPFASALLAAVLATFIAPPFAAGGDFTVETTLDGTDAAPGDGVCAAASGECTLRAAIEEANALPGGDRVVVPAGTYVLGPSPTGPPALGAGDGVEIRDDIELIGSGAFRTVIEGSSVDQVIDVKAGQVRIADITVRGGATAGLVNVGSTWLSDSLVERNSGAGIVNRGDLTVTGSTVARNTSETHGAAGIVNEAPGMLTLANTTVSGNDSVGIENQGEAFLNNVTIAFNTEFGIENEGRLSAGNSLLVRNGSDCSGVLESEGHNIIDDSCGCIITGDTDTNVFDIFFADLGPLRDNGGPTPTRALLPGHSGIDNGDPETCERTDQRGLPRPLLAGCDIGAYEASQNPTPGSVRLEVVGARRASTTRFRVTCTLDHPAESKDAFCDTVGYAAGVSVDECPLPVVEDTGPHFKKKSRRARFTAKLTPAARFVLREEGELSLVLVTTLYDGSTSPSSTVVAVRFVELEG